MERKERSESKIQCLISSVHSFLSMLFPLTLLPVRFSYLVLPGRRPIARVLARMLDLREPIDSTRGNTILWEAATALLPKSGGALHTSALMELGALLCTPAKPQCLLCPVRPHCRTRDPESLPMKKPRRKTVALREDCAWIVRGRRILLEQQTGTRWRGLWKLPALAKLPADAEPLTFHTYPFTHHRVNLSVFAAPTPHRIAPPLHWFLLAELNDVALAAPHRRAIDALRERT